MGAVDPVIDIITQHAEETCFLWYHRRAVVHSPHFSLRDIARHDDRLAAHIDGLRLAGAAGVEACELHWGLGEPGAVFAAAVLALEAGAPQTLEKLFAIAESAPPAQGAVVSGFGWISAQFLQGTARELFTATSSFRRFVAVACCAMHRVDPGLHSGRWLLDRSPLVSARALRATGELGLDELAAMCATRVADEDFGNRFWAAWSAVLLGNRGVALEALTRFGLQPGPHQSRAFRLMLQAMSVGSCHRILRQMAADPQQVRWLMQGSAVAGDMTYVPWLINNMRDEKTARMAGEAFSLITGLDLAQGGFDTTRREHLESGPNDDPDDPNVDMDPDQGLPWPHVPKIEKWWTANSSRFQKGQRYFMGAPVTREHCIDVLKNGYQRQRILAAHYLCLLEPGTPLFNTSAPAWRQQRLLAAMT